MRLSFAIWVTFALSSALAFEGVALAQDETALDRMDAGAEQECLCGNTVDAGGAGEQTESDVVMRELQDRELYELLHNQIESHTEDRQALGANFVLWCYDSNDPRCIPASPRDDSGSQSRVPSPGARVIVENEQTSIARQSSDVQWMIEAEARPSDGIRSRVERPPRG